MATLTRRVKSRAPVKVTKSKSPSAVAHQEEEEVIKPAVKGKKSLEIELPEEPAVLSLEEKPEDETPVVAEDAEELAAEEVSLDDDELNPFGDKWEQ